MMVWLRRVGRGLMAASAVISSGTKILFFLLAIIIIFLTWLNMRPLEDKGVPLEFMLERCGKLNVREVFGRDIDGIVLQGISAVIYENHLPIPDSQFDKCVAAAESYRVRGNQSIITMGAKVCSAYEYRGNRISLLPEYVTKFFEVNENTFLVFEEGVDFQTDIRIADLVEQKGCSID